MKQAIELKQILKEMKEMKKDIHSIKQRFEEINLTNEEEEYLEETLKEHKKGKSVSLDDFEKEMQNA